MTVLFSAGPQTVIAGNVTKKKKAGKLRRNSLSLAALEQQALQRTPANELRTMHPSALRFKALGRTLMAFMPKRGDSIPTTISPIKHILQAYENIMGPRGAAEVREAALRQQYTRLNAKDIPTHPDAEAWRTEYTEKHKIHNPNLNHPIRSLPGNVTSRHPASRKATYDRRGWTLTPPPHPFAEQGQAYQYDPASNTFKDIGRPVKGRHMLSYWFDRSRGNDLSHPIQPSESKKRKLQADDRQDKTKVRKM